MPKRAIVKPATAPAGRQIELEDDGTKFTLFIPDRWKSPASGEMTVIAHFHGAVWFAIDEHLRHGLNEPLICFALGEGSSVYGRPFKDRQRFGRVIALTEAELRRQGAPANARIVRVDVSSFSAGYGAVREIVQVPEYVKLIRRIVLADSMYAGWDPATTQPGATSRPARENIDPWVPFVSAAARGEKVFVFTHSEVPTPYANSAACAKAMIEIVGATIVPVERGSIPATLDPDFPLLYRADLNGFHVWGYGGVDAQAHMTHPRHIAEIWQILDDADSRAARPDEVRRGMSMRDPPEVRYRRYYDRLARQIEPDLRGDPERMDVYLRFFEREIVRDKRLFATDIQAAASGQSVTLTGVDEFSEQTASLSALLDTLGFKVSNHVKPMPTAALGPDPFAVVSADRTFIYSAPAKPREVLNESLRGEALYLLDFSPANEAYLCHASDGYVGWVAAADVHRVDRTRFTQVLTPSRSEDPRIESVIAAARARLGQPYVWGGRSEEGVDCSGLVQRAFASIGMHLPRDAEQQAIVGKLVATRWHRDGLRRGDVLFFLGRRGFVAHTAIYLGDDQFIEASDDSVKISSFSPSRPNFAKKHIEGFCFAKRFIE
jgi:cell wall-associated NlpC family hydrolase